MKVGLRRDTLRGVGWSDAKEALGMLYVGLDFSRKRLQWSAFDEGGLRLLAVWLCPSRTG